MGLVLGIYGATGATGWTSYTGAPPTIYYVSKEVGAADTNPGTAASPFLTLTKAQAVMAALPAGTEAWLLLRKGDTWSDETFDMAEKGGLSATNPLIYSCYDPATPTVFNPSTGGARPLIKALHQHGVFTQGNRPDGGKFFAVIGVDFYAYTRDPTNVAFNAAASNDSSSGMSFSNATDFILIEDCRIAFFSQGMSFQGAGQMSNILVRRCVIANSYHPVDGGRSQGFAGGPFMNLTLEECVLDTNGWNPSLPATQLNGVIFNHNIYISGKSDWHLTRDPNYNTSIVRGCVFSNDCSGAKIGQSNVINNLFVRNPIQFVTGTPQAVNLDISYNVFLEAVLDPRGTAVGGGVNFGSGGQGDSSVRGTVTFTNNIFANSISTANSQAIDLAWGVNGTVISNNIFYNWVAAASTVTQSIGSLHDLGSFAPGSGYGAGALFTGSFGATFTGTGSGTNLTVTAVTGYISVGDVLAGTGIPGGTTIASQTSGTIGGAGVYVTSVATTASAAAITGSSIVLSVSAVASGTLGIGQVVAGAGSNDLGIVNGPVIKSLGTGTGGVGTYNTNIVDQGGGYQSQVATSMSTATWYGIPLTGGTGNTGYADITVNPSGQVSDVKVCVGIPLENYHVGFGTGYLVGNTLSASPAVGSYTGVVNFAGFAHNTGSGFSISVNSLAANTVSPATTSGGNNVIDATGANNQVAPEPFPLHGGSAPIGNNSLGAYYASIGNPGGFASTTAGFISAVRLNSKANWDPRLTANAANNYIRAGFGIGGQIQRLSLRFHA